MMNKTAPSQPNLPWETFRQEAEQDCACAEAAALLSSGGGQGTTDCACAPALPSLRTPPRGQCWQQAPFLYRVSLPGGHELGLSPYSPCGPVVLNEAARRLLERFASPTTAEPAQSNSHEGAILEQLAGLGLLLPAEAGGLYPCAPPAADTLTVWLHTTNACNLRCTYCYVRKDGTGMDEATGRAALETALNLAAGRGFRAVKLKYAGGEPTLKIPLVQSLHYHARDLAHRHGLELRETLITNGVVLPDALLSFVAASGMRLAVSLDISCRAHDARRVRPDGGGTFEQVCCNIERALTWGIHPYLSITVTGEEGNDAPDAVVLALERGLPFNLNLVRPTDGQVTPAQIAGIVATVRAAFAQIGACLPRHSLTAVLDRADFSRPHRYPCGAGRAYLVVDHRGRFASCQMELDRPAGDASQGLSGDFFPNPSLEERHGCAGCRWQPWCAGGCPWLARRATGRSDLPSPYCAAYRALFPDLLRLEGLRLLKHCS